MGGGRDILFGFSRNQRKILTDLMYAGLSEDGRNRVPEEFFTRWSGVHALRVVICGDPAAPPYQDHPERQPSQPAARRREPRRRRVRRTAGVRRSARQRAAGLPGNVYRDQFLLAQRILRNLDAAKRKLAVLEEAPVQTGIELQGRHGTFPGIAVSALALEDKRARSRSRRAHFGDLYRRTTSRTRGRVCRPTAASTRCFSVTTSTARTARLAEGQVFRLEGPGSVMYFRGYPHVHAFINIAMNADAPLSSGEELGENPAWLDRAGVKALFETALRAETGADLAFYPQDSVAGRLRPGVDPFGRHLQSGELAGIRGGRGRPRLESQRADGSRNFRRPSTARIATKMYAIATTAYAARELRNAARKNRRAPAGSDAARPHRRVSQTPRVRRRVRLDPRSAAFDSQLKHVESLQPGRGLVSSRENAAHKDQLVVVGRGLGWLVLVIRSGFRQLSSLGRQATR